MSRTNNRNIGGASGGVNSGGTASPPPAVVSGLASFNSLVSVVCEVWNDDFAYDHLFNSSGGNYDDTSEP